MPAAVLLSVSPVDPVPPCPLRTLTGIPCPLCGSTRGVIAAVHGHIGDALALNPASIGVLVLALLLVAGWRIDRVRIPVWVIVTVVRGALGLSALQVRHRPSALNRSEASNRRDPP